LVWIKELSILLAFPFPFEKEYSWPSQGSTPFFFLRSVVVPVIFFFCHLSWLSSSCGPIVRITVTLRSPSLFFSPLVRRHYACVGPYLRLLSPPLFLVRPYDLRIISRSRISDKFLLCLHVFTLPCFSPFAALVQCAPLLSLPFVNSAPRQAVLFPVWFS